MGIDAEANRSEYAINAVARLVDAFNEGYRLGVKEANKQFNNNN